MTAITTILTIVTLPIATFQIHMSWPFLVRPSDDPGTVGLLSLRLETSWLSTPDSNDGSGRAASTATSPSCEGLSNGESGDWGQAGGGREGPVQWHEDKAVDFIQVCGRNGRR